MAVRRCTATTRHRTRCKFHAKSNGLCSTHKRLANGGSRIIQHDTPVTELLTWPVRKLVKDATDKEFASILELHQLLNKREEVPAVQS